jgi:hypothetical protein
VNCLLRFLSCLALALPTAALADGSPSGAAPNSARSKLAQEVRETADAAASSVGAVTKGPIVIPVGSPGSWSRVEFYQDRKFKSGFIPTDSIDAGAVAAAPTSTPTPTKAAAPGRPATAALRTTPASAAAGPAEAIGGLGGATVPLLCTEDNAGLRLKSDLVSFSCNEGSAQSGYDACDLRIRYELTGECKPTRTIKKSVACQVTLGLEDSAGKTGSRSFSAVQLATLDANSKSGVVDIAAGPFAAPRAVVRVAIQSGSCRMQ